MTNDERALYEDGLSELLKYKDRLKSALKAARMCVFEVDLIRQIYTFFENSEDIFGVPGEAILADIWKYSLLSPVEYQKAVSAYFSHPDDEETIAKAFHNILNGVPDDYQARMKVRNTNYIWCKISVTPIIENGLPVRMIGVITDITDWKTRTEVLERETRLDLFTGLYTKTYAEEMIKKILVEHSRQTHALILFDLDNFKAVNDTYGHVIGDEVLKSVSDSIRNIFEEDDIKGRFGGDEFIILLTDLPGNDRLISKLEKLQKCSDDVYGVTISIGVSIFPNDATDYEELLRTADNALYRSKELRDKYTLFSRLPD